MKNKTANKGEWSEIYTLFKLLSEGKLYAADSNLEKLEEIYYLIIKIISPSDENKEYHINSKIKLVDGENNETIAEVPIKTVAEAVVTTLKKIKKSKGTFSIPEVDDLFKKLRVTKFKADSTRKPDITMKVHDINTGIEPFLSFSIKSKIGSSSTLFNASKSTNFTYKVVGDLSDDEINEFNQPKGTSKMRDKMTWLEERNLKLEYKTVASDIFLSNLFLIDSSLPDIIAESLLIYYSGRTDSKLDKVVSELKKENPLNIVSKSDFYKYKYKRFLTDIALGMRAAEIWNGEYEASGGCIVVREDGEVLCYHIYNMNEFRDYLFDNTRFETPSTTRHEFGQIYKSETGENRIKLNLQIRFI